MDVRGGGHGKCGKCLATVTGDVSAPTEDEKRILAPEELAKGIRLACRVTVLGDCTAVTAEQVAEAARKLTLHTTYILKGENYE